MELSPAVRTQDTDLILGGVNESLKYQGEVDGDVGLCLVERGEHHARPVAHPQRSVAVATGRGLERAGEIDGPEANLWNGRLVAVAGRERGGRRVRGQNAVAALGDLRS